MKIQQRMESAGRGNTMTPVINFNSLFIKSEHRGTHQLRIINPNLATINLTA